MDIDSQRQTQVNKKNTHQQLPLKYTSSDSSDSSVSSVILSMCPLAINSDNYSLINDNQTCQVVPELMRSHRSSIESKFDKNGKLVMENEINETVILTQNKIKRKLTSKRIMSLLNLQREYESSSSTDSSSISTESCLRQLLLRPQLFEEIEQIETKKCPSPPPPAPVRPSICLQIPPERINQFKQRQNELDRAVKVLLETFKIETNETINQISKYWSYLKQIILEKYQPKNNRYQLFDYLLKSVYSNNQFEVYCEENDEIKAALQVLTTTLIIVQDKHSFSTINQLFDNEEKLMIENLHDQLVSLLSSYTDALSFIRERINFYQTNFNEDKSFDWIQIIQIEYPCLIEKISNDFIIKTPQIEQILIQMLRNMKKHLLNIHIEINEK